MASSKKILLETSGNPKFVSVNGDAVPTDGIVKISISTNMEEGERRRMDSKSNHQMINSSSSNHLIHQNQWGSCRGQTWWGEFQTNIPMKLRQRIAQEPPIHQNSIRNQISSSTNNPFFFYYSTQSLSTRGGGGVTVIYSSSYIFAYICSSRSCIYEKYITRLLAYN